MEEQELDVRRYWETILQWWWFILLAVVVGAGSGYVFSRVQEPLYEATTKLMIQESSYSPLTRLSDMEVSQRLANTYSEMVKTSPVLQEIITELQLDISLERLKGNIDTEVLRNTQLLRISVTSNDPAEAQRIANTLTEVFIRQSQERRVGEVTRLRSALSAAGISQTTELLREQIYATGNIVIVEPARLPQDPVSPRTTRNVILALLLGAIVGIIGSFFLEYLREGVRTPEHLRRLGLTALGIVPWLQGGDSTEKIMMIPAKYPGSLTAEAFRVLRQNLYFCLADKPNRVLMVTSALKGEGKSFICSNLAATFAQGGKRVLLIDADLRKGNLCRELGLSPERGLGLSDLLANHQGGWQPLVLDTEVEGLHLLPAGSRPPNPVELLGSKKMSNLMAELAKHYEVIIVDSPPVLGLADTLALAPLAGGVILVANVEKLKPREVESTIDSLKKGGSSILGAVINKADVKRRGYYYSYHFHDYSYGKDGYSSQKSSGDGREPRPAASPFLRRLAQSLKLRQPFGRGEKLGEKD